MQIAQAEDSAQIASIRGKEREFKTLLTGAENALDNFRVYFVRQTAAVDVPRHKHNFDQIRVCLEGGPQNYGAGRWIAPGEVVYFPEGTPYGPEQSDTERLSLTFQFGGASGNGFVGSNRLHAGMEEMKAFGTFEKGVFIRTGELAPGEKRNQDSFEAIWEHINQRKLVYPKQRYAEPVHMKPANFEWEAREGAPGVHEKQLAIFSERNLQIRVVKLDANARATVTSRGGVSVGFVLAGGGSVNGQDVRKHTAFSGSEDFVLTSADGMEALLVGLPVFKSQAALLAAE